MFETCFLNAGHPIIPVVAVMAAAEEAAARTRAVGVGSNEGVGRGGGQSRRADSSTEGALICSPHAPSLLRTRLLTPAPRVCFSGPTAARGAQY